MPAPRLRSCAIVAALAAAVALAPVPLPVAAQMTTPLQGSGNPGPNTTGIYLSVYLGRLLAGAGGRGSAPEGCLPPHAGCEALAVGSADLQCQTLTPLKHFA